MSQTAKILKMKSLGFTLEQIAVQLSLDIEQLKEIVRKESSHLKQGTGAGRTKVLRRNIDRPPQRRNSNVTVPVLPVQEKPQLIQEIKPGFYVLTADDLLRFATGLHEQLAAPPDPYHDYVQKDIFQKQYGISETTLQRHQKDGLLMVYKLGNKQYLKKSQIVEALEKGKL